MFIHMYYTYVRTCHPERCGFELGRVEVVAPDDRGRLAPVLAPDGVVGVAREQDEAVEGVDPALMAAAR